MKQTSATYNYQGTEVKVQDGKVFAKGFGTTVHNSNMRSSWLEIPKDNMKQEFRRELEKQNLIK